MKTVYRIYPAIGIARIGNSDADYFLGPEAPGIVPDGPFRDNTAAKNIKPQGVRFRIYEFERNDFGIETFKREVVEDANTKIFWTVHLANSKAAGAIFPPGGSNPPFRNPDFDRAGLTIDGMVQKISGKQQSSGMLHGTIKFVHSGILKGQADVALGSLRTDQEGRLIVIGGPGKSGSPIGAGLSQFANNDGWYDGISDGPVSASVSVNGARGIPAEGGAWVLIAPPKYAPGIASVTSWYDQCVNVEANHFNPGLKNKIPSFTNDIYPVLYRTVLLHWVLAGGDRYHGGAGNFITPTQLAKLSSKAPADKAARQAIFNALQPTGNMPKLLSGLDPNNPATTIPTALTEFQRLMMQKWANGNFLDDWNGVPVPVPFSQLPPQEQPAALTRAALEPCVGAPFYPGIEGTYLIAQYTTYESPFRVKQSFPPGFLTQRMAVPWQADFRDCGELWWPAQRPVEVNLENGQVVPFARGISSYGDMVKWWSDLGFIVAKGDQYVETERLPLV